jgi:SulP family sulfate permease
VTIVRRVARLLPGRSDYAEVPHSWRRDVLVGLTVGVVALPLALAFGVSSGVGAAAGLVTAVVAGVVAGVVAAGHVLPWPVIEGFTLGIAAIIFLQQVPSAFGGSAPVGERTLVAAWHVIVQADAGQALKPLGLVAFVAALPLALPRLHRTIPASLVAVIAATVVVQTLDVPVARIGALPSHLAAPLLPHADLDAARPLLGAALAIAGLAAIESLLSARVAATMAPTGPYDPDRELVGQGLASVASGMFGGMPATRATARTAVFAVGRSPPAPSLASGCPTVNNAPWWRGSATFQGGHWRCRKRSRSTRCHWRQRVHCHTPSKSVHCARFTPDAKHCVTQAAA